MPLIPWKQCWDSLRTLFSALIPGSPERYLLIKIRSDQTDIRLIYNNKPQNISTDDLEKLSYLPIYIVLDDVQLDFRILSLKTLTFIERIRALFYMRKNLKYDGYGLKSFPRQGDAHRYTTWGVHFSEKTHEILKTFFKHPLISLRIHPIDLFQDLWSEFIQRYEGEEIPSWILLAYHDQGIGRLWLVREGCLYLYRQGEYADGFSWSQEIQRVTTYLHRNGMKEEENPLHVHINFPEDSLFSHAGISYEHRIHEHFCISSWKTCWLRFKFCNAQRSAFWGTRWGIRLATSLGIVLIFSTFLTQIKDFSIKRDTNAKIQEIQNLSVNKRTALECSKALLYGYEKKQGLSQLPDFLKPLSKILYPHYVADSIQAMRNASGALVLTMHFSLGKKVHPQGIEKRLHRQFPQAKIVWNEETLTITTVEK